MSHDNDLVIPTQDKKFAEGKGVVFLLPGMSDADLLAAIKSATAHKTPFLVVPSDSTVFIDSRFDSGMIPRLLKMAMEENRDDAVLRLRVLREGLR